jgi:hypothetical protein
MWSIPRFQTWLAQAFGREGLWEALLQPAMKHVAICTLKSAQVWRGWWHPGTGRADRAAEVRQP